MIGKTNAQRKILLTTPSTVTPTKSQQIITTPNGYDGMDQVTIAAIPSSYIQPTATQAAKTWTPTTTNQTIAAGTYCSGEQIIKGDSNLKAENIKSGISVFNINGSLESGAEVIRKMYSFPTNVSQTMNLYNIPRKPVMIYIYMNGIYTQQFTDPNIINYAMFVKSSSYSQSVIMNESTKFNVGDMWDNEVFTYDESTQHLAIDFSKYTTYKFGFAPTVTYYLFMAY